MTCPFCEPDDSKVFYRGEHVIGLWDAFPVNEGHALLIPTRHVADWFEATEDERSELMEALSIAKTRIDRKFSPDGYNVGFNAGAAAGQTVFHLHVHVIPRYAGDVDDPRGGVRGVISSRGNYLIEAQAPQFMRDAHGPAPVLGSDVSLVGGAGSHLAPQLIRDLADASCVEIAVAFVVQTGLNRLLPHLEELLEKEGSRLRLLTGDYLDFADPQTLTRLFYLQQDHSEKCEVKIYETRGNHNFHPKSYLFTNPKAGDQLTPWTDQNAAGYVGSSNISKIALEGPGVEWNLRVTGAAIQKLRTEFDTLFEDERAMPLTEEWIQAYAQRRKPLVSRAAPAKHDGTPLTVEEKSEDELHADAGEEELEVFTPHLIQQEALDALQATREEGFGAGLVVLATGLGKTWLAAFDSERGFKRVLFIAHREEILSQARNTFLRIRPEASLGYFHGTEKSMAAEVVFASIQTLSRDVQLKCFAPDDFDYIVVDEFHHAAASTYEKVIDYFEPKFLLGLTATPERADGGNILRHCQENLVYRADVPRGIEEQRLCPFAYHGVPDDVDYAQIPWRSGKFHEEALARAVETQARAQNALEQWRKFGGRRTLAFCVSRSHADFMADYFEKAGLETASVHSGPTSAHRTISLESLRDGKLDVLFAVDMFNEGVDIPDIDTVLMLRPTQSKTIWMQQLGRGLRCSDEKEKLSVIDYIGNHKSFLVHLEALAASIGYGGSLAQFLAVLRADTLAMPAGCEVTYELEAMDVLDALAAPKVSGKADAVRLWFDNFRELHGQRPTALEAFHEGIELRDIRSSHGGWLEFVAAQGALTDAETEALTVAKDWFDALQKDARMSRTYKMVTLLAMASRGKFPGAMDLRELTHAYQAIARKNPRLRKDVSVDIENTDDLHRVLVKNPVKYWQKDKDSNGRPFFAEEKDRFIAEPTTEKLNSDTMEALRHLTREITEWRLVDHLKNVPLEKDVESKIDGVRSVELWHSYMRADIAPGFGLKFVKENWNQGYVSAPGHVFLLVTQHKTESQLGKNYEDGFASTTEFHWQSQDSMNQTGKKAVRIKEHKTNGHQLHLFVREKGKQGSRTLPFVYCGDVDFVSWEKDKPISVVFRLKQALPEALWEKFGLT